jgi:hypothetical protein
MTAPGPFHSTGAPVTRTSPGARRRWATARWVAVILLAMLAASEAPAQVVRGSVLEVVPGQETPVPVAGAVVRLTTADSQHVDMVLTSRDGTFQMAAPRPGQYRLQVQHVLFLTASTPTFAIPPTGTTTQTLTLTRRPQVASASEPACERQRAHLRAPASPPASASEPTCERQRARLRASEAAGRTSRAPALPVAPRATGRAG